MYSVEFKYIPMFDEIVACHQTLLFVPNNSFTLQGVCADVCVFVGYIFHAACDL